MNELTTYTSNDTHCARCPAEGGMCDACQERDWINNADPDQEDEVVTMKNTHTTRLALLQAVTEAVADNLFAPIRIQFYDHGVTIGLPDDDPYAVDAWAHHLGAPPAAVAYDSVVRSTADPKWEAFRPYGFRTEFAGWDVKVESFVGYTVQPAYSTQQPEG